MIPVPGTPPEGSPSDASSSTVMPPPRRPSVFWVEAAHVAQNRAAAAKALEAAQAEAGAVPQASAIRATPASFAANRDQSSAAAIGAHNASTSSIRSVQGASAK